MVRNLADNCWSTVGCLSLSGVDDAFEAQITKGAKTVPKEMGNLYMKLSHRPLDDSLHHQPTVQQD